jgi:hypothetical protein
LTLEEIANGVEKKVKVKRKFKQGFLIELVLLVMGKVK